MGRPPKTLNNFIGQPRVVGHLERLIKGALQQDVPCPSLMLSAPSGYGKTAIAEAISRAYGTTLHVLFAGPEAKPYGLACQLLDFKFGDILFIDEAHSLPPATQELLLLALDKQMVPTPGEEKLSRSKLSGIVQFTLILASNKPSAITKALRNRLKTIEFEMYTVAELKAIAEYEAVQWRRAITPQAARCVAEAAQGTPRGVNQLIHMLRLYFPGVSRFSQENVQQYLTAEGIRHGLRPHQQTYLITLAESKNGSCTLSRIAAKLGQEQVIVRDEIEPFLLDQDLIDMASSKGRMITAKGRAIVAELKTAEEQEG